MFDIEGTVLGDVDDDQIRTFQAAVRAFEDDADWLTAADMPAVVTLRNVAAELDAGDLSPALISAFGLTYRSLLKRAPSSDEGSEDPLEKALHDAES